VIKRYPLAELVDYIDWTPFFQAWELSGPYPKILEDPVVGEAARKLFAEAQETLRRIVRGNQVTANGVFGLFPAARVNSDDIEIYRDERRRDVLMTWHNLRQQNHKPTGRDNLCLADFAAPGESGVHDWIGAFAVSAGGIERRVAELEAKHDDYAAIMLKVLADRLAEAFAERLHERVQTLRECFRQAVGKHLEHDGGVIVVLGFQLGHAPLDAAGADREGADPVVHAAFPGSGEVGEAEIVATGRLVVLLPQVVPRHQHIAPALIAVDFNIVAIHPRGGKQAEHSVCRYLISPDDAPQGLLALVKQLSGCFAYDRVPEDLRIGTGELPGLEERRPVDVVDELGQRIALEHRDARFTRRRGAVSAPVGLQAATSGLLERMQRPGPLLV